MSIAFFDLDRTLIATNSATGWIRREIRLGHLGWLDAARGAGWIALYQLGFAGMESALRDAVGMLTGAAEADLHQRTRDFWREEVHQMLRPGAREAVERHRAAGDVLALLTTSSNYLGQIVAEELGLQEVLCNRFEVVDGLFTGAPVEPLCFGVGKLVHAQALAEKVGADLADCAFYTDSYSDLPVLEAVGRPVVVHPDPRLARVARARGWPIERW